MRTDPIAQRRAARLDDRVFPGDQAPALLAPSECFVNHHGPRHSTGVVAPVERQVAARAAGAIAKMGVTPDQAAGQPTRTGINEKLVRIETQAAFGLIGAMNAIAVELARRHIVQITMPHVFAAFRQRQALQFAPALRIEQTKLDFAGIGGK